MNTNDREPRTGLVIASVLIATLVAIPSFAQVSLVKDINPGVGASSTGNGATAFGTKILFAANDGTHGYEPWVSDGTAENTFRLSDILVGEDPPGPCGDSSNPVGFIAIGDLAYFQATDHYSDTHFFCVSTVWKTDGTTEGTEATSVLARTFDATSYAAMGSSLYLRGWDPDYGEEIWKIDGGNQYSIRDIEPETYGSSPGQLSVANLDSFGDRLFFTATTTIEGFHPWVSDGTPGGTALLKEINEYSGHSGSKQVVGFDGRGWFQADDGVNGAELWVTDGDPEGITTLFLDIDDDQGDDSFPQEFTVVGSKLFFVALYDSYDFHLWVTDGTVENTHPVVDPGSEAPPTSPMELTVLGGKLYFTAESSGGHGRELWVSDGTAEGTMMVVDLYVGANSSNPEWLTAADGKLFFSADTPGPYRELWVSNGTAEGTMLVEDLYPGGTYSDPHSSWPNQLVPVDDTLFFFADNGTVGNELWKLPLTDFVTTPDTPSDISSGQIDTSFSYSTGGSISLEGADVQYLLDWDDGTPSDWLPVGATSADHSWSEPGTYTVTAQARSATEIGIVSKISAGFDVEINDDEIIEAADVIGPTEGWEGLSYEYTFGATSSKAHQMEYSITWGPGETTDWADLTGEPPSVTTSHTWTEAGPKTVVFTVRCASDTEFEAYSSISVNITVEPEEEISSAVVTGPTTGIVGVSCSFTLSATSNLDHDLEYLIHWGDGTAEQWLPFGSGLTSIQLSHAWDHSEPDPFPVDAEVRCIAHQIGSPSSDGITIEISDPPPGWIFGDGFESGNLEAW